jgi:hypothetical protein
MTSSNKQTSDNPASIQPSNLPSYDLRPPVQIGTQQPNMDESLMLAMLGSLAAVPPVASSGAMKPSLSNSGLGANLKDRNHGLEGACWGARCSTWNKPHRFIDTSICNIKTTLQYMFSFILCAGPPGYIPRTEDSSYSSNSSPSLPAIPAAGLPASLQPFASLPSNQAQHQRLSHLIPHLGANVPGAAPPNPHSIPQTKDFQLPVHGLRHPTQMSTSLQPSRATVGPATAPQVQLGADSLHGSSGLDSTAIDLLMETMDAWEAAVTKRLSAALHDAVRGARSDVMQVLHRLPSDFLVNGSPADCSVNGCICARYTPARTCIH